MCGCGLSCWRVGACVVPWWFRGVSGDGEAFRGVSLRFGPQCGAKGRQRDRRVQNRQRRRVDAPVIEVLKRNPQERVEEPTAERTPGSEEYSVTTAAEAAASTVVESVDGCEVWHQVVEVLEFVFRDRIQQRAFEQLA